MQAKKSRTYPDGQKIDPKLPSAYKKATGKEMCSNCTYITKENKCTAWGNAVVRNQYYCKKYEAS